MTFPSIPSIATTLSRLADLALRHGGALRSWDVRSAYRVIPVHPEQYHLLIMKWGGHYFVDTKVPFGLRSGGALYYKLGAAFHFFLHSRGFNVLRIMDDHLLLDCGSLESWQAKLSSALSLAEDWGIPRHQ